MSKDRRSIEIVANGKSAELGRISLFPVGKKGGANVKQVEHQINTLFAESRKATASPRPAASTPEVTPRAEAPTPPPVEEARQATQSSEYTIVHPQPKADPTATDTTFTPSVPQEVQVEVKAEPKRSGLFKKLAASLAAIASVTGAGYLGFPHLGKVSSWLPMKLV